MEDSMPDSVLSVAENAAQEETHRTTEEVDALLELHDHRFHGLIRSREEYALFRDRYIENNNQRYKTKPDILFNFPQTREAVLHHVRELFEAIVDFNNVIEGTRPGHDGGRAPHVDQAEDACRDTIEPAAQEEHTRLGVTTEHFNVRRVRSMTNAQVEIMAWDLLHATQQASLGHPSPYPWPAWKSFIGHKQYASWTERFHHVKEECRKSKNAIANMMMARFLHRFASAPEAEFHRKVMNKKVNRRRDVHLKAAAHAIKAGEYIVTEGLGLQTRTGHEIAPENQATEQLERELSNIKRRTSEPTAGRASKKRRRHARDSEAAPAVPLISAPTFDSPATAMLAAAEATTPVTAGASVPAATVPGTSLEASIYPPLDFDHLHGQASWIPMANSSIGYNPAQGEALERFGHTWPVSCDFTFIPNEPHVNPGPLPPFDHFVPSQQVNQPPLLLAPTPSSVQEPISQYPNACTDLFPSQMYPPLATLFETMPNDPSSLVAPDWYGAGLDPGLWDL